MKSVHTSRLVLRGLRAEDRAAWIDGIERSRALHSAWSPLPPVGMSLDERFDLALDQHEIGAAFRGVAWVDGRLAAWVNLNDILRGATMGATCGWSVHADFAGQGIATEAVSALLDLAFARDGMNLHRVSCGIMPHNTRSLRVAEKVGFRREGYAKELVCIAGEWQDHLLFARLASEHVRRWELADDRPVAVEGR